MQLYSSHPKTLKFIGIRAIEDYQLNIGHPENAEILKFNTIVVIQTITSAHMDISYSNLTGQSKLASV